MHRKQKKSSGGIPSYTQVFADALIGEASRDESVVAVHAAMGGGTGLNHFERFFAVCLVCECRMQEILFCIIFLADVLLTLPFGSYI